MKLDIPVFTQLGIEHDPPPARKSYQHSQAMKAALARAREHQPPIRSLSDTTATDYVKEWTR